MITQSKVWYSDRADTHATGADELAPTRRFSGGDFGYEKPAGLDRLVPPATLIINIVPSEEEEIELECDEIWSFSGSKKNPQWLWLILAKRTRLILAVCVGDRCVKTAEKLWQRLPKAWGKQAKFYTDFWQAYAEVIPAAQHEAVAKSSGKTSLIERFNNTLRQRVGRLVRKTLSFSKSLENHIGIIFNFIHHYNASLLT